MRASCKLSSLSHGETSQSHYSTSQNLRSLSAPSRRQTHHNRPFNNAQGTRSGCQKSGFLMVHKYIMPKGSGPRTNWPISPKNEFMHEIHLDIGKTA